MRQTLAFFALLFLFTTAALPQDDGGKQLQTWGAWSAKSAEAPFMQARAKCNHDFILGGRWLSDWSFQFRSGYQQSVDYVYVVEFGDRVTHVNHMTGPFLDTIGPGQISAPLDSELYGKCSQHMTSPALGIHIHIKCVALQGKDDPCYKDSNGSLVAKRPLTTPLAAEASTPKSGGPTHYWSCELMLYDEEQASGRKQPPAPPETVGYLSRVFVLPASPDNNVPKITQKWKEWGQKQRPDLMISLAECEANDTRENAEHFTAARQSIWDEGPSPLKGVVVDWKPK